MAVFKSLLPMFIKKVLGFCVSLALLSSLAGAQTLTLNKGDHICLIGSALALLREHRLARR